MVESPPADAGDAGSWPGPGRSHMPRSGWAREPWPLSLRVRSLCSTTGEATTVRGPRTAKKKKKKKLRLKHGSRVPNRSESYSFFSTGGNNSIRFGKMYLKKQLRLAHIESIVTYSTAMEGFQKATAKIAKPFGKAG